jgi:bifunctional enzyme CysN/CysC
MSVRPPSAARLPALRFLTCGSVDDGKSTLIGRLLYEQDLIQDDQLAALEKDSLRYGADGANIDFALLVDGLEAEREQGITIDVAYRYFSTPRRSFIVADTPGHEQYTRNMATGASNADLAIVLVDARKGLLTQTFRHAYIVSLLGIRHVLLAVNKIDLVGYDEATFNRIAESFARFARTLGFTSVQAIPVSARHGDNISAHCGRTPWHQGPTLLHCLETAEVEDARVSAPMRYGVQWVNRPDLDFRGFSGTVLSGVLTRGDRVVVAGSGRETAIERIVTADGDLDAATAGDAVTVTLADEVDVARGDLLVHADRRPHVADQFAAHLIWMNEARLLPGRSYLLKCGARTTPARVTEIRHRVDVNTLDRHAAKHLDLNEVGYCNLATSAPIAFDAYADNRETGGFILIDRMTNATVAAGMIAHPLRRASNVHRQSLTVTRQARAAIKPHRPAILWFTGLSGAGKSTIANIVEASLNQRGAHTILLDGDNIRHGLNKDLGFTDVDRVENIRRVGEVARLMTEAGLIALCAFISPFRAERQMARELAEEGEFIEIFVDAPIEACIRRDPKGLYKKALAGQIRNFTGIDQPYEPPEAPEITLRGDQGDPADHAATVIAELVRRGVIAA